MAYDAFISYSHAADGQLAPALQRGLQRFAKPWHRRRALHVFRDETALATNPHLWASVEQALDESEWFVVLASPASAASAWVNKEVAHWLATKPADRVLPVVTDGTWEWDDSENTFDIGATAVPPALGGAFAAEPRYLDLRWARTESQVDLRNGRFRSAVADLAAPLHGVPKDELEGEDVKQHRRTVRLASAAAVVLAFLLVAAVIGGVMARSNGQRALRERDRANDQTEIAEVRRLAAEAIGGTEADPARSLLLAVEAHRRLDSVETRSALLTTLLRVGPLVSVRALDKGPAVAASFSSDGRRIALADGSAEVRVISAESGEPLERVATTHDAEISLVRLSPDGELLVTGDRHGAIEIRAVDDGALRCPAMRLSARAVAAGAFTERGAIFVAQDEAAYQVRAWHTESCTRIASKGNIMWVVPGLQDVAVSPDGGDVAFAAEPVEVWDERLTDPSRPMAGAISVVRAVSFTPDGARMIVADERRLHVFDVRTGDVARPPIEIVRSKPDRLRVSPDARRVAVALSDGSIDVIDLETGAGLERPLLGLSTPPLDMRFADAERLTAVGTRETAVWNVDQLSTSARSVFDQPSHSVEYSPDGHLLAIAAEDGAIHRVDLRDGQPLAPLRAHTPVVAHGLGLGATDVGFDPEGRWIVSTADTDAVLAQTNLRTGEPQRPSLRVGKPLYSNDALDVDVGAFDVALDSSGRTVAVANGRGEIIVLDTRTGKERWRADRGLRGHWSHPIAFVGDGELYAGTGSGLAVYDARDGRLLDRVGREVVTAVASSPDGEAVAAAYGRGSVVVLDARTRRERFTLANPDGLTTGLAFIPRHQMLAATTPNGTIALWDLRARRLVAGSLPSPTADVGFIGAAHVATSPDGASIAVAYHPGGVVVWSVDPEVWRDRACALVGRNLSRSEWNEYSPTDSPFRATCPQWPLGRR